MQANGWDIVQLVFRSLYWHPACCWFQNSHGETRMAESKTPCSPDVERFEEALSIPRLVCESRCRLGPGADVTGVVADLRKLGIDVDRDDVVRVWDEMT